jgi:hypothetical protein
MNETLTTIVVLFAIPGFVYFTVSFLKPIFASLDRADPANVLLTLIVTLCFVAAIHLLTQP